MALTKKKPWRGRCVAALSAVEVLYLGPGPFNPDNNRHSGRGMCPGFLGAQFLAASGRLYGRRRICLKTVSMVVISEIISITTIFLIVGDVCVPGAW